MPLTAAHRKLRELKRQSQLSNVQLAHALGISRTGLENHLAGAIISAQRAAWYLAIVAIEVSDGAVHLVVQRPESPKRRK